MPATGEVAGKSQSLKVLRFRKLPDCSPVAAKCVALVYLLTVIYRLVITADSDGGPSQISHDHTEIKHVPETSELSGTITSSLK